ncbi:MAG: hypothetical protein Q7L55_13040 [Actinomycetota bacterium]|nr:hypothetical protein [Actinomycetota bacterium]
MALGQGTPSIGIGEDRSVDLAYLLGYLLLAGLAFYWGRSTAWWVISIVASISIAGGIENLAISFDMHWTRSSLQLLLLAALAVPAALAWLRRGDSPWDLKRQLVTTILPTGALLAFVIILTTRWTTDPAFLHPVSFLIGHSVAEDNAKWLDFTSQLASGQEIVQSIPMGGPLALVMVFVATLMGVVSWIMLGGYNEVAVAANTVVMGQYFFVIIAPLALAPLVEARLRRKGDDRRIPAPFIWLSAIVIAAGNLVAIGYGHLTFQYVVLLAVLWAATFLADVDLRRARLLTSLAIVISVTVWFPMNALSALVLLGCVAVVGSRLVKRREFDWVAIALVVVTAVCVWEPIWSSISYVLESTPTAAGPVDGGALGVVAGVVFAGLSDSTLFAAGGGTDQTGPILAIIAVTTLVGAVAYIGGWALTATRSVYMRFLPLGLLIGMALAITFLDAWATGGGPHYGAMKFTFIASLVVTATCLPVALLVLAPKGYRGIAPLQWVALVIVFFLLSIDTVLPRALAEARPQAWSPAIPFDNASSYWYPAEVNGTGTQPIATNPVACVYLPQGAGAPSALTPTRISDPQRVYSCSRLLAGLSASDAGAQPIVDWLRREWFTNTEAWSDVYDSLAGMSADVLAKPVILLDEGSNVIGLDSMGALLQRYPRTASINQTS